MRLAQRAGASIQMFHMNRAFSLEDVRHFAAVSGDTNPMHVDPLRARRMMFNRAVAHGMLLTLQSLEAILATSPRSCEIAKLHAVYRSPVGIGENAKYSAEGAWPRWRFTVSLDGTSAVSGTVEFREREQAGGGNLPQPAVSEPSTLCDDDITGQFGGELLARIEGLDALLPMVADSLPAGQLSALLAVTRIVGMRCPGERSILSEVKLTFPEHTPTQLDWKVEKFDRRFARVSIAASGAVQGEIVSFVRPISPLERTAQDLRGVVRRDEFSGRAALIVGGTRGLGAAVARVLSLGGASVIATYRTGAQEAFALEREIHEAGGSIRFQSFDTAEAAPASLFDSELTDLYYMATPSIFRGRKGAISTALFEEFNAVFIDGFLKVFGAARTASSALRYVLYPSSSVLSEPQPNLVEYAMSKQAAEEMIHALAAQYPALRFDLVRFPRLATDQTINLAGVPALDAADAALRALRGQPMS